jgi:hypothetical protein
MPFRFGVGRFWPVFATWPLHFPQMRSHAWRGYSCTPIGARGLRVFRGPGFVPEELFGISFNPSGNGGMELPRFARPDQRSDFVFSF